MTPEDAPVLSDFLLDTVICDKTVWPYYPCEKFGGRVSPAWLYVRELGHEKTSVGSFKGVRHLLAGHEFARWARKHHHVWAHCFDLFPTDPTQRVLLELLENTP